jgi:hypothetical protein
LRRSIATALRSNTTLTELGLGDAIALDEAVGAAISGTLRVNQFISNLATTATPEAPIHTAPTPASGLVAAPSVPQSSRGAATGSSNGVLAPPPSPPRSPPRNPCSSPATALAAPASPAHSGTRTPGEGSWRADGKGRSAASGCAHSTVAARSANRQPMSRGSDRGLGAERTRAASVPEQRARSPVRADRGGGDRSWESFQISMNGRMEQLAAAMEARLAPPTHPTSRRRRPARCFPRSD